MIFLEPVAEEGKGPATELAGKNYYYPYYLGLLFNPNFPAETPRIGLSAKEVGEGLLLNPAWLAVAAAGGNDGKSRALLAGIYPDGTAAWNDQWPAPEAKLLAAQNAWDFPAEGKYDPRLAGLAAGLVKKQADRVQWNALLLSSENSQKAAASESGTAFALYKTSAPQTADQPAEDLVQLTQRMEKSRKRLEAWEKNSPSAWDDELLSSAKDMENLARLALEAGLPSEADLMLDRLDLSLELIEAQDPKASPPAWAALQEKVKAAYQKLDKLYPDESKNGRDEAGYLKHFAAVDRYWNLHGELAGLRIMVAKSLEEPAGLDAATDENRRRHAEFRLRQIEGSMELPAPMRMDKAVPVRAENAALLGELSKLAVWDSAEGLFYAVMNDPNRHDVIRFDPSFHFMVNNTNLIKNGDFAFQMLSNDLRQREENNREVAGFVPGNAFRPPEDFALVRDYEGKKSHINPVLAIHFIVRQELLRFKYEKLQPAFDAGAMSWNYGRVDPLASRLVLSASQAAEGLAALRGVRDLSPAAALPDLYLRRGLLLMHAASPDKKLEALGDFWKSTLLSRTILALCRAPREPEAPVQVVQAEIPTLQPAPEMAGVEPPAANDKPVDLLPPEQAATEPPLGVVATEPGAPTQASNRPPKAIPVAIPVDLEFLP